MQPLTVNYALFLVYTKHKNPWVQHEILILQLTVPKLPKGLIQNTIFNCSIKLSILQDSLSYERNKKKKKKSMTLCTHLY